MAMVIAMARSQPLKISATRRIVCNTAAQPMEEITQNTIILSDTNAGRVRFEHEIEWKRLSYRISQIESREICALIHQMIEDGI